MSDLTYHVDGRLVPADEATVSVDDRGFRYGDAAFETLRAYGGTVFAWQAHADRLEATCETLGFERAIPPRDDLLDRIEATLAANDLADAYVRLSLTRGVQDGKLTPDERVAPTVVVVVKPLPRGGVDGEPVWDEPATLQTVETRRPPASALPPAAKTHNYLNGILARLELRRAAGDGSPTADEAIMLDAEGAVVEGATSNLFLVDGGELVTPRRDLPLLPGITREIVLEIARAEDLPVSTARFGVDRIRRADEVFATNTTWEVRPVTAVDGIEKEVGPMTEFLQRRYTERVQSVCYE
jgi:branched-chain amino acid aminotransferase